MKERRRIKFCFLLSDEEKQKLDALAEDQDRSAAGTIRNIIRRRWDEQFPEGDNERAKAKP